MKEVASEKEAMDEIKRYLEVNGLECTSIGMCKSQEIVPKTREVLGEYKVIFFQIDGIVGSDLFIIRYTTNPPYSSIEEVTDKWEAKQTVRRGGVDVLWIDEFRNYIHDLSCRKEG